MEDFSRKSIVLTMLGKMFVIISSARSKTRDILNYQIKKSSVVCESRHKILFKSNALLFLTTPKIVIQLIRIVRYIQICSL